MAQEYSIAAWHRTLLFVGGVSDPDAGLQTANRSKWNAKSASETPPTVPDAEPPILTKEER
jgi:hypothetical protein